MNRLPSLRASLHNAMPDHGVDELVDTVSVHMVSPQWAARVVSPLHDVLSENERSAILADNPDSYLHVTSDPLALPEPPGDAAAESVQARALRRLLDLRAYTPMPEPAIFVYRLTERGRDHTGVIASVAVEGFGDGRVLGHERVQPERVAGLVGHYQRVPMRSELVALFHPVDLLIAELTARVVARPPLLHFTDASGAVQSVWQAAPAEAAALTRQLAGQRLYVADGHHRVAAATRFSELPGWQKTGKVLCALYPQDEIVLHAFHRRVRGPVALPALFEGLTAQFDVSPIEAPSDRPCAGPGRIGLHAAGRWWALRPRAPRRRAGVAGLDVTMLEQQVLGPILGMDHGDSRLEFVPDLRDLGETTRACNADAGVLFTLRAPGIEDVVSVAERHEVMSTKTTYVQPKPRTGIFLSQS
jgi:uncharacterized protein (DUF1015 family)